MALMKTIILILLALVIALNVTAKEIPDNFFNALHQVETGGRMGAIKGDDGKALGPFQIHRAYWQDSGIAGKYEDCASYEYSKRVVRAYLKRYGKEFIEKEDWQSLARIHNGGPQGHKKKATLPYWEKVKKHLDKNKN